MDDAFEAALLAAHARNDLQELTTLYSRAADHADDTDTRCFFLTQAYVFALDFGDARAKLLYSTLKELGREA